ncbi:MAG: SWIM zinc finger family protein [Armatimonadetes bacterium]|nr:SWIM zinc finger family protein [Armatimonadota bacterium]
MESPPTLSESAIRERVGDASFQRGLSYYRDGALFDARRSGMALKARCEGSRAEAYRLKVIFDADGITDAECSCPVGGGGRCKHTAALLLTWLEKPEEFRLVADTDTVLGQKSKEELVALVRLMIRREPELEGLLETPLPATGRRSPVDPETYRRQVERAFRSAQRDRRWDWGDDDDVVDGVQAVVEVGDGFLEQGDAANAAIVYAAAAAEIMEHFGEYQDESGSLASAVHDCVRGLSRYLAEAAADAPAREPILRALFDIYRSDVQMGGIGLGEGAPTAIQEHATPDEKHRVAGWVREAMPVGEEFSDKWRREVYGGFLLRLEADTLDDESFLRICRETGRRVDLVERLVSLGRTEEAMAEGATASVGDLTEIADAFVAHGHADIGEQIVVEGARKTGHHHLLEWLKTHYAARGDRAKELDVTEELFRMYPSFGGYKEVRDLARGLGVWEATRPGLIAFMEGKQPRCQDALAEVYLDEGDLDRALEVVSRVRPRPTGSWNGIQVPTMKIRVAEAAEGPRPEAALAIYLEHAQALIEARGRGNYAEASRLLVKARALHERLGRKEEWERYLADLKARNRRLRALTQEMERVGL